MTVCSCEVTTRLRSVLEGRPLTPCEVHEADVVDAARAARLEALLEHTDTTRFQNADGTLDHDAFAVWADSVLALTDEAPLALNGDPIINIVKQALEGAL